MEHTPGLWHFYTEPQPNGCPIVGANGLMIAMLAHSVNYPDQKDTALANARLIAAAPELLEALEQSQRAIEQLRSQGAPTAYWDDIEATNKSAIAKARGIK